MCLPLLALPAIIGTLASSFAAGATAGAVGGAAVGATASAALAAGATASTVGSTVALGVGIGSNIGTILTLAAAAIGTGLSIKGQQEAAQAQVKQAKATQQYEHAVAAVEDEQSRQAAQTKIETSAIQGARAVGEAQASGLSASSVARLTREARAMTLRDMADAAKQAQFGRQATALDRTGSNLQAKFRGESIRAEARQGINKAIFSGLDVQMPSLFNAASTGMKMTSARRASTVPGLSARQAGYDPLATA